MTIIIIIIIDLGFVVKKKYLPYMEEFGQQQFNIFELKQETFIRTQFFDEPTVKNILKT